MLLGTNIVARRRDTMEILAKGNSSTNLGLPTEKEKERAFTGVHGVDRAMASGPNAFPEEMVGGNSTIQGMEVLRGSFGGAGGSRERE
jgi:hypothetical protein